MVYQDIDFMEKIEGVVLYNPFLSKKPKGYKEHMNWIAFAKVYENVTEIFISPFYLPVSPIQTLIECGFSGTNGIVVEGHWLVPESWVLNEYKDDKKLIAAIKKIIDAATEMYALNHT
jgi:hypothetical protein